MSESESESESEPETEIETCNADKSERVGKFGPGDFDILRVVGQGAFGKVFQVVRKRVRVDTSNDCEGGGGDGDADTDGDGIYAMKVMRKDTIIKKNHVDYMRAERDILTKVVHPFIVQLRYSFQVFSLTSNLIKITHYGYMMIYSSEITKLAYVWQHFNPVWKD